MDLIEVLWKQDVDLGFTPLVESTAPPKKPSTSEKETDDEIEKLKALEAINSNNEKVRQILFLFSRSVFIRYRYRFESLKIHATLSLLCRPQLAINDLLFIKCYFLLSRRKNLAFPLENPHFSGVLSGSFTEILLFFFSNEAIVFLLKLLRSTLT